MGFRFAALLALSSCIIYRIEASDPERSELPDPEPPAPLPSELSLVVDRGDPGETLRTALTTNDPIGLEGLQAVRFERDVTVVDAVFGPREASLVLRVSAEAAAGDVDLTAQFDGGRVVRVGDAFTILSVPVAPTGDTASIETTGDTGAAATGDTGDLATP